MHAATDARNNSAGLKASILPARAVSSTNSASLQFARLSVSLRRRALTEYSANQTAQALCADRRLWRPRNHGETRGKPIPHFSDERRFSSSTFDQHGITKPIYVEALIDHPGEGNDSGTGKVRLQAGGFVDGRCFRQSHEQDASELSIAQTRK